MIDAPGEAANSFPSLAALRQAHASLLQRHRSGAKGDLFDEIEALVERGSETGGILDDDSERWEAQGILDYWLSVLYRARREPSHGALKPFDPSLAPSLPDEACPYRGLETFREAQHGMFFGRSRVVSEMVARLSSGRLLVLVGSSGSGKSSLVMAGLIPALKAGRIAATGAAPASDKWEYLPPIVPGIHPLVGLAAATVKQPAGADAEQGEAEALAASPARLLEILDTFSTPAVIVVDQFEEVFTLCTDDQERRAFVQALLAVAKSPGLPHRVVLTMRSDFDAHVAALPALQTEFERVQYRVPPFNAAELREVIEKPAELVGLKFEAGIVDRLVTEILGEPAGLPLLQFALLKLWERRDRNRVTFETYRSVGGPLKALERSAEELYARLLPEEQVTARRILLRIVRPGASLEVTSNRVPRESVHGSEPRDRVDRVLDKLIAAGLLRQSGGPDPAEVQIEVAHEALLRNWPRLVEWLDDERARLRRRFSVTAAAQQWAAHGKDPGGLLGGSLLEEARTYDDLDATEREFIAASQNEAGRVARQKERVLRLLVVLLVLVVAFAVGLGFVAVQLRRALLAERQQRNSLEFALQEADRQMAARVAAQAEAAQVRERAVTAVEAASQAVASVDQQRVDSQKLENAKRILRATENAVGQSARRPTPAGDRPGSGGGTLPGPLSPPAAPRDVGSAPAGSPTSSQPVTAPPSPPRTRSLLEDVRIRASSAPTGGVVANTTLPQYDFKIWLEGRPEALARIRSVQYEFDHPTFREKVQRSDDRRRGFAGGYRGWGCLSSVKVTLFPVDSNDSPATADFDMCAAVSFRYKK